MNFLACDGDWIRTAGGYLDCAGTLSTVTLDEIRESPLAQLTAEQKGELTVALLGFFCLIFVLVKVRRLN